MSFDPSRISPLARYMFSVIPEPTFPDRNPLIINNFEGTGRQFTDQWTTTIRIDHSFTEKDQIYGRYLQGNQNAQTLEPPRRIPMLDEVANYTRRPNYNKSLATVVGAHLFADPVQRAARQRAHANTATASPVILPSTTTPSWDCRTPLE